MLLIPSTSGIVTKTQYDSDKQGLERKIEDILSAYLILLIWKPRLPSIQKPHRLKTKKPDTTGFISIPKFNRLVKKVLIQVKNERRSKKYCT